MSDEAEGIILPRAFSSGDETWRLREYSVNPTRVEGIIIVKIEGVEPSAISQR